MPQLKCLSSESTAAAFTEALPVLCEHLAFLDKNISRPLREYNDCQVTQSDEENDEDIDPILKN